MSRTLKEVREGESSSASGASGSAPIGRRAEMIRGGRERERILDFFLRKRWEMR